MYVMNDAEKKLVDALRSGEYEQGKNSLRPTKNKFCCLGVACDVLGVEWEETPRDEYGEYLYETKTETPHKTDLPSLVRNKLNWSSPDGTLVFRNEGMNLAELNDEGFTFNQIADLIENGLILHKGESLVELNPA